MRTDLSLRYYTTDEAAALARCSVAALAKRRERKLPPRWVKPAGLVLYPADEFDAWLEGEGGSG